MKTNLQNLRKDAGFSSARVFAEYLGISVNTYTGYEQGKTNLSLEQAWKYADVLGEALGRFVSLDELAGRDYFPAASDTLTPSERELIEHYRDTDERGQRMIDRTARGAAEDFARGGRPEASPDASGVA